MDFRWNDWNIEHIARHGVDPDEAEQVVRDAKTPFPLMEPEGKLLVWGAGRGGRLLQVVYVLDATGSVFVVHARMLTEKEKRRYRRRTS